METVKTTDEVVQTELMSVWNLQAFPCQSTTVAAGQTSLYAGEGSADIFQLPMKSSPKLILGIVQDPSQLYAEAGGRRITTGGVNVPNESRAAVVDEHQLALPAGWAAESQSHLFAQSETNFQPSIVHRQCEVPLAQCHISLTQLYVYFSNYSFLVSCFLFLCICWHAGMVLGGDRDLVPKQKVDSVARFTSTVVHTKDCNNLLKITYTPFAHLILFFTILYSTSRCGVCPRAATRQL